MARVIMTTSTPYAAGRMARQTRVQMRRLGRRANAAQAVVRAAMLATVLVSLALGMGGALRSGSARVAASLDSATQVSLR
jgi:hypothetical protein